MTTPVYDQDAFRFRLGDPAINANGAGDWLELINVDPSSSSDVGTQIRLRFLIQETAGGMGANQNLQLEYNKQSEGWNNVTASSSVIQVTAASYAENATTTQLLGGGTYVTGEALGADDVDGVTGNIDFAGNDECEAEFSFIIVAADVNHADTILLRIASIGYTNTPTITVNKVTPVLVQANFRIRSDDATALNTDSGWEAALNINATIDAEKIFRIRFEVEETASGVGNLTETLYVSIGGGAYAALTAMLDDERTVTSIPAVEIIESVQYTDAAATTNILSGSAKSFVTGAGREGEGAAAAGSGISINNEHTEIEYALVIHSLYTAGMNTDGETFAFRIRNGAAVLDTYTNTPTVTMNQENGIIGGCYCESPNRMGPFIDTNGNLYFILEQSRPDPDAHMLKSTDGGATWDRVDVAGAPTNLRDLESHDIVQDGDTLHIAHQATDDVFYYTFRMSDHASPDTWNLDETIVTGGTAGDQTCALVYRSDTTVVAFYNQNTNDINYKIRSSGGTWSGATNLDTEATDFMGVSIVKGASDLIHIFYTDNLGGILYHRTLSSGDSLSARGTVSSSIGTGNSDKKPTTEIVYYDDGGVEVISTAYILSTGALESVQYRDNVIQTALAIASGVLNAPTGGASRQPVAWLGFDGVVLYCFYADAATADLWWRSSDDGAAWSSATEIIDGATIDWVRGNVITHSVGNGGNTVAAFVVDDRPVWNNQGDAGESSGGRYYEYIISTPSAGASFVPQISRRLRQRRGALLRM